MFGLLGMDLATGIGQAIQAASLLRSAAPNSGPPLSRVSLQRLGAYLDGRVPERGVKYFTGIESGKRYGAGLNGKRAVARRLRQIEAGRLTVANGLVL